MMDKENFEIPAEILEAASAASIDLLPQKTKERYQKEYEDFLQWRENKQVKLVSEDVLLAYVKGKSENYSPTSMWTKISMLKLALKVHENIDISRFGKLFMFLRRKTEGYQPKKSKILSEEEVTKFLTEADDDTYLFEKVVLMFGIFGACRRDELIKLNVEDFENNNSSVLVKLRCTKNKKSRAFLIPKEGLPFNAYGLYKKYADLRPVDLSTSRFFIGYRKGKCVKQVVGIHTIGAVPKKIATYLKLENPELYTGHTFRRSSATMLVENGGDLLSVKELGGWQSSTVAESYIEKSVSKRMKITKQLFQNTEKASSSTTSSSLTSASDKYENAPATSTSVVTADAETPFEGLQIVANSNCEFNINIHYKD